MSLLIHFFCIKTQRLTLRLLQPGEGNIIFQAIDESRIHLSQWLPWPKNVKEPSDSETFIKNVLNDYFLKKNLILGIFFQEKFIGICSFNYFK